MKKREIVKNILLSGILLCFLLSLSACPDPVITEELAVEISEAGWIYNNLAPEYLDLIWQNPPSSTCYFTFSLWYTGTAIQPGELTSFTAVSGNVNFEVPVDNDIYKDSTTVPDWHGLDGYYSYRAGDDTHYMPLGPWTFTLRFIDGTESVYTRTFNKPGTKETTDNTFIVTEDYSSPNSIFLPMVKRANISSANYTAGSDTLSIQFSMDDVQARSGWVVLLDADATTIWSSDVLVDSSGIISDQLGGTFHTDGAANTFTIVLADYPEINADFDFTHYITVNIVDGKQYESLSPGSYDCRSVSAPMVITKL